MPSSRACTIPPIIAAIKSLRPRSILDVGVGFGKWGYLFREYTDVLASEADPQRYDKAHWQVRIEGIEGHEAYLHDGHRFAYDRIHVGAVETLLPQLGTFDVIFFGDIIEHFEAEVGRTVLQQACEQCRLAVLLTTPRYETHQGGVCDNPLEQHRSLWGPNEFAAIGPHELREADSATWAVAFPGPGAKSGVWEPPRLSIWERAKRQLLEYSSSSKPLNRATPKSKTT